MSKKNPPTEMDGDPRISPIKQNPYVVLPSVSPNDSPKLLQIQMKQLQASHLTQEQDQAFRSLRNIASRLSWDLRMYGTTPRVPTEVWSDPTGDHVDEDSIARIHIDAVLSLNHAIHKAQSGEPNQEAIRGMIAWWSALLSRAEWLRDFARFRCDIWGVPPPDSGQFLNFVDRAQKAIRIHIRDATGESPDNNDYWNRKFDLENASVEVIRCVGGNRPHAPGWLDGFGPIGLQLKGVEEAVQAWIAEQTRAPSTNYLPISSLKVSTTGPYSRDRQFVAGAARAVQAILSELGHPTALIWQGRPQQALDELRNIPAQNSTISMWFGTGTAAKRGIAAAVHALTIDALLTKFKEELSRPDVSPDTAVDTAARLLQEAGNLPQPRAAAHQLEVLLCGRLAACNAASGTAPLEVERILRIGLETRSLLLGYREGSQSEMEMSRLLNKRATKSWHRVTASWRSPKLSMMEALLRDLFLATDLAPHNQDAVINLAGLVVQFPVRSAAESMALRQRALAVVERCISLVRPSADLEEQRDQLFELIDPEAARKLASDRLRKVVDEARQSGRPKEPG